MSFSYDVKSELCALRESQGTQLSLLYGLLIFGRSFSPAGIALQTEHDGVAARVTELLSEVFGVTPVQKQASRSDGHAVFLLNVESPEAGRVYDAFGYGEKTVSLRINRAMLETEEAVSAFLRGAFLSCGSVVDPEKDYHLEFVTPHLLLSRDLNYLLGELNLPSKTVRRKSNHIVYFKDSGQIEDVLTLMGAVHRSLDLMNVKIYKDLRNKANRLTNCETANIEKTVNASTVQVEAINRLTRSNGFEALPEELREIARLRLENPDISLRELGTMLKTPISRSGVNHRLTRLIALAEKMGRG